MYNFNTMINEDKDKIMSNDISNSIITVTEKGYNFNEPNGHPIIEIKGHRDESDEHHVRWKINQEILNNGNTNSEGKSIMVPRQKACETCREKSNKMALKFSIGILIIILIVIIIFMAIVINTDNKNDTTTINIQRQSPFYINPKKFISKIKNSKSSFNNESPPYVRMVAQSEYNGGVALGQNSQISMPSLNSPGSSNTTSYPPYI